MNALDAFRDVRRELDRVESASFTIKDFNYWINLTLSEYITENYPRLDVLQKESDDIRKVTVIGAALAADPTTKLVSLPGDYRHILYLRVKVKFTSAISRFKLDDTTELNVERMKSGQKGFRDDNAYGRPSWKRPYYEISGSQIRILLTGPVTLPTGNNLTMDYIKEFDSIFLSPADGADYNNPANNTVIDVPKYVYYEVVKRCRNNFLANTESPRTMLEEQLTNSKPE